MNTTATATAAVIPAEAGPAKLLLTLLDDSVVELETRGWDIDILLAGTYRAGYFKATNGRYISASQIKFAAVGGEDEHAKR